MFKVVTRASEHEHHGARLYRSSQSEGEARLVGDGPAQQGAVAAVRLEVVVLHEGVKHRCLCAVNAERPACAFIPGQDRLLELDTGELHGAAGAGAPGGRRGGAGRLFETRGKNAPLPRGGCKKGGETPRGAGPPDGGAPTGG